jgi:Ran GTPase-activating protein (RanGAP) involved in mRNA processing and transport
MKVLGAVVLAIAVWWGWSEWSEANRKKVYWQIEILKMTYRGDFGQKTLDLSRNDLGPEGGKALAEALKANTALQTLDISRNDLGPEGGKALAEALKVDTAPQTLDVRCNTLGPEGFKALSEVLKVNTTLQTLALKVNND